MPFQLRRKCEDNNLVKGRNAMEWERQREQEEVVHTKEGQQRRIRIRWVLGVSLVSFELNCRQLKAVAGRKP